MLRFFTTPAQPSTRFESCNELSPLYPVLARLRHQVQTLHIASKGQPPDTLVMNKYDVMASYLSRIEAAIAEFNLENTENGELNETTEEFTVIRNSREKELQTRTLKTEMYELIVTLTNITEEMLNNYHHIINATRNWHKEIANSAIDVTVTGGAFVAACATMNFLTGTLVVTGASVGNRAVRDMTGISDLRSTSECILSDFIDALKETEKKINPPMIRHTY